MIASANATIIHTPFRKTIHSTPFAVLTSQINLNKVKKAYSLRGNIRAGFPLVRGMKNNQYYGKRGTD